MIDQLSGPMSRINATVDGSVSKIDRLNQSFGSMTKTGLLMAGVGMQISDSVLKPVEATFDTRRALGELASLGTENLGLLEQAARDFSDQWAGTTKSDFLTAAYSIKSGIASLTDEGVAEYTRLAGLTGKATKASVEEMTSLFATGYGIYKDYYKDMSDIEFAEAFSAGISDSIRIFKTSGSGMSQAIQTLGAAATSANVPLEEQLAIVGMLQATMSGSEAGTKYKAFFRSAAKAGEELGLKFTDTNNQLLSMPEILSLLRGKFGETMDAAEKMQLQKAFGTDEAVALIDLLYNKTGELQDNILLLYDSMGQGADIATKMAGAINETEGEKYTRLTQRVRNLTEEIGKQLLPTYNQIIEQGERVLQSVGEWIAENQELVKVLAIVLLTIGGLLTGLGTLIGVFGAVGMVITKTSGIVRGFRTALRAIPSMLTTIRIMALYAGDGIRAGFKGIGTVTKGAVTGIKNVAVGMAHMARQAIMTAVRAMPGLIASVWSFTAALLANPITWVVVGIMALIAALVLLWQNWDAVVSFLSSLWDGFVNGIVAGFDWIRNLFNGMPGWLQVAIAAFFPFIGIPMLIINNWSSIKSFFSNLWSGITDVFQKSVQWCKDFITGTLSWFRESGSKVITTFTDGIKSVINAPVNMVKSGLAKVRELLPFSDAHEGPLSELTLSGRRVFETIGTGMEQSENVPAEMTERAFAKMDLSRDDVKKINLRETIMNRSESNTTTKETDRGMNIERLELSVDLSSLKDLPALFKLLEEIRDYTNSNGMTPSTGGRA
ncbi:phage tail tape measure protein [Paenibacillus melissococcoides]|uniref:Phage tail tape measure protein n=10 Tax=Paenibacillus TaxID=44249 RepID=A0ABM9GCJ3_9BACL|nr:phage tail tape measure protein [Paenibacillus melissococcoides]CAH8721050.1 phage tail tape measure protein [Paenibacillus melissococcoides]